jgi:hypothetical protein
MAKKNTLDSFFAVLFVSSILPIVIIYIFVHSDTGSQFLFAVQNPAFSTFLDGAGLDTAWRILGLGVALLVLNFGSVIMLLAASLHELESNCIALERKWLPTAGLIIVGLEVLVYLVNQFISA